MSIVLFLSEITELGVGASIVQSTHVSDSKLKTGAFVNLCIVVLLVPVFWGCTGFLSHFFQIEIKPYVLNLFLIFSVRLFLSIPQSLLVRHFEFKKLSQTQIIVLSVNLFVSIILIYLNYGLNALLISQVICSIINFFLLCYYAKYFPKFSFQKNDFIEIYHFGKSLTVIRLIRILSLRIDKIIIGRISGMYLLGIYERIQYIFEILLKQINTTIDSVLFSTLSKNKQQDDFVKQLFSSFFEMAVFYLVVAEFIIINNAAFLLRIMLGGKWNGFENIFIVFSLIFFFSFIPVVIDTLVRSRNKMTANIKVKVLYLLSIVVFTSIGANHSILWAAVGILLASFIHFIGMMNFVFKEINISMKQFANNFLFPSALFVCNQGLFTLLQSQLHLSAVPKFMLSILLLTITTALFFFKNILQANKVYVINKNLLVSFIQVIKKKKTEAN